MTPGTDGSAERNRAVGRGPVSLRRPEFRNLGIGTLVSTAGTQMAVVALGLIGLFKAVPVIVLGLGGGVVADARDRRKLLLVTQTLLAGTSAMLAMGLVYRENLVHEFRSRRNAGVSPAWRKYPPLHATRRLFPRLRAERPHALRIRPSAPPGARSATPPAFGRAESSLDCARVCNRRSRDMGTYRLDDRALCCCRVRLGCDGVRQSRQGPMIVGPGLAGLAIAHVGLGLVYGIDAVSFVAVVAAVWMLSPSSHVDP